MNTINFNSTVTLTVTANDNELSCQLNPDSPLNKTVDVYRQQQRNMGAAAQTVAELGPYLVDMLNSGESTVFAAVASNYSGGGTINFQIKTDTGDVWPQGTLQPLPTYTSQQWAVAIRRN